MIYQRLLFTGLLIVASSVVANSGDAYARGGRFRGTNAGVTTTTTTTTPEIWQRNNWGVSGFGRNYGGPSNGYGGYYYGPNANYPVPGGFPTRASGSGSR